MKQSNIEKLEKYRYVLEGKSFSKVPGYDLNEVLEVIRDEWDPGYNVDFFCGYCVLKMVENAFNKMNEYVNTV